MVTSKSSFDEASAVGAPLQKKGSDLWRITEYVERPAKRVPVIYDVDIVVVGGGIAGVIAAVAAARHGAKTLIVEAFSYLGGNMGPGFFAGGELHLALKNPEAFPNGLGGIPEEFNRRVVQGENRRVGVDYFRDSHSVACVATRMLEEAGVEILLSTVVCDVIKDGNKVRGLYVENKSGTLAIKSKAVIDCTGTADVADRAGAPVVELPENPAMGIFFAIAGVDADRYQEALNARGELAPEDQQWLAGHAPGAQALMPWVRESWEAKEFRIYDKVDDFATLEITINKITGNPPQFQGRTRVNGRFHPGDGLALSRIQQAMWPYLYEFVLFLNKRVPGFEKAYLLLTSPYFHARGGKSIDGEYLNTGEDVTRSARFDDVIFIAYDDKRYFPGGYDIPYRILLPKGIDGLLAAGRSAIVRGPQLRQRCFVQLMGQAAGVAAALAVKHGLEPRNIHIRELQNILRSMGAEIRTF